MRRHITWPRIVLAALLLLGFSSYAIPKWTQGWYRDRVLRAMQDGLGRKVEIGEVNFRVLPTPGLAIHDVRIAEDPSIGAEPAAYADTLVVRPSILALLTGHLKVGSATLEGASLNFTRIDDGPGGVRWNFTTLTSKAAGVAPSGAPTTPSSVPAIHMSGGRVNFKFGDTKSIFYLLDTDIDLSPSAVPNGPLKIRIGGEPARTDRFSRGFGSFVAEGKWNPSDHSLEMDVRLEKSELSDVLSLFEGSQSELLGTVWGDAHLAGPMSKIGISGKLNVSDLHGWNQSPPGGNAWPLSIGGTIDVPGQHIELQASGEGRQSPIAATFHVADYLRRPRWAATVNLNGVPVAPLTGIARNFGIAIPADVKFDGTASGVIGYSSSLGSPSEPPALDGSVRISNTTLTAQGGPPLKMARADVRFSGSSIALSPTAIVNDAGESADIDGQYDMASGQFGVSLTSSGMSIASLRRQVSVAGVPLVGLATAGMWSGSLHFAKSPDTPGGWTGDIHLKDTEIPFEAFAQPIHLHEADATLDATGAAMKHISLTVAGIAAKGDYRYDIGTTHPHRFSLTLPATDAADIQNVLMPALRRASFLTYAFNFGRVPQPGWLRDMHAEGTIQASSLAFPGVAVKNVKTTVIWDGSEVKLTGLQGHVNDAALTGAATIHLAGRQPRYELTGTLANFPWQGGTLTATAGLRTFGMGDDLLANLRAEGTFTGRNFEIPSLNPWDSVDGKFDFGFTGASPRLHVSNLTIQSAGARWTGAADTQDSGQTVVRVADGVRHLEASGALLRGETLKPLP
ncbi:MAG TPA: AsmA family protein [Bryobacteraceae bacterium]|nr:AsmA family protein [Bryobacteraceae bacterium]